MFRRRPVPLPWAGIIDSLSPLVLWGPGGRLALAAAAHRMTRPPACSTAGCVGWLSHTLTATDWLWLLTGPGTIRSRVWSSQGKQTIGDGMQL